TPTASSPLRLTSPGPPTPQNTEVLLIQQKTREISHPPYWTFPKGHPEDDDASLRHTAIRELFEETGLRVEISDFLTLRDENNNEAVFTETYTNPIRKAGKEVRYWAALVKGEQEVAVQE
ncbi:hypothetical protein LSUE1_G003521, partial [Lachnellula suecica]